LCQGPRRGLPNLRAGGTRRSRQGAAQRLPVTGSASSAAGNAPLKEDGTMTTTEVFTIPLAKMSAKPCPGRVDSKGIVSAIFLALAMIGLLQFGERLDTLLFGGLFPVSGRIISMTMIGLGTMLYGLVPGIIVADINPLIATATGTSPIAPFWLITNASQAFSAWLVGRYFRNIISWPYVITYSITAALVLVVLYIPLHVFYFKMPWQKMLSMYAFQTAVCIPVPAIFLRGLLKVIRNAGFVEE
jgi:hypothetical protein